MSEWLDTEQKNMEMLKYLKSLRDAWESHAVQDNPWMQELVALIEYVERPICTMH